MQLWIDWELADVRDRRDHAETRWWNRDKPGLTCDSRRNKIINTITRNYKEDQTAKTEASSKAFQQKVL